MRHYANPDETVFTGSLFVFHFGAYGDTEVAVYQRPGRIFDALETAAEWLKENEPGHFVDEPASEEELEDLTYTESGWLPSWEWLEELDGDDLPLPTFDRFDICEAYAAYWAAWHQGLGSRGYKRLCVAQKLAPYSTLNLSFDTLSENGQAIYRKLVLSDGR